MRQELVEDKKNQLTERLSSLYARNQIGIEEYERLIDYAQRIETNRELRILETMIIQNEGYRGEEEDDDSDDDNNSTNNSYAILSTRRIDGSTIKRAGGRITCILGSQFIDFSEKDFRYGKITLDLLAFMGDININIPYGVKVINRVIPIMGEIKGSGKRRGEELDAGISGTLVLTGAAILANIKIKNKN